MSKRNKLEKETLLNALKQVKDPKSGEDLVSREMVRDLKIEGDEVTLTIVLPLPSYSLRTQIEADVLRVMRALSGVEGLHLFWTADVPSDERAREGFQYPVRNAIAVASGKGGVGKSTIAVNIAVSLAQSGVKVGLLDADIYGPNVPTMMGIDRLPPPADNKMTPGTAYGVQVMSIGFLVKPEQPLIWRGPMLHSAIRQFVQDVSWGKLDYLIVDLPPGTGDAPLSVAQSLPLSGGVIVTLPQQVSLDDARRSLEMFRQLNVPLFGVVENMSYLEMPDGSRVDIFGSGGGARLAREAGIPFIGTVPMDPAVREGGDSGKPVVATVPDSPVAQALHSVADDLAVKAAEAAFRERENIISIDMIG